MSEKKPQQENGFLNILFNILIPILILNKVAAKTGPFWALILALAFPLGYGIYDLIKRRKTNPLSVLGLLNVGLTGGLALAGIHGMWFAVKEAAFPTLVGLFVFGSAFTKKPFVESLFLNPGVMNVGLLEEKLKEHGKQTEFHQHLRKATMWLSLSFVFSAICNFTLAVRIFKDIDGSLPTENQATILNEQIARMTGWSMAVIMGPSIIFLMGILWYVMRGIKTNTGLKMDDLMEEK